MSLFTDLSSMERVLVDPLVSSRDMCVNFIPVQSILIIHVVDNVPEGEARVTIVSRISMERAELRVIQPWRPWLGFLPR